MFEQMVDWVSGSNWSYVAIFAVAVVDAFFPLVPSESMVIIAGALAGAGDLRIELVILAAASGAIVGDNISYGIGKLAGERTVRRLFRHEKAHKGFDWAEKQLVERGSYIILIARFIPFGRTAVTFTAGYTQGLPWHRFFRYDVIAGVLWGTYAAMLGYIGGKQFEEQPWKGVLLGLGIAFSVAFVIEWVRHRRAKKTGATHDAELALRPLEVEGCADEHADREEAVQAVDPVALLLRVAEKRDLREGQDEEAERETDRPPVAPPRGDRADHDRKLAEMHEHRPAAVQVQRALAGPTHVRADRERLQEDPEDHDDRSDEHCPEEVCVSCASIEPRPADVTRVARRTVRA